MNSTPTDLMSMMNKKEIMQFDFDGMQVRTVLIDDDPWFVGKDVATILGYSNPRDALAKHVDDDDKNSVAFRDGTSGNPNMTIINESGVYALVFGSKLPQAKNFKRWVTSEVLPTIRKTGGYGLPKTLPEALRLAANMAEEIERLDCENQAMKPKALFADSVESSKDSILIGQLAKLLTQNGFKIGQNRLFQILREQDYLCTRGENKNIPTQRSMEQGLMEIQERTIIDASGNSRIVKTTKITGKGQIYFINKFCKKEVVTIRDSIKGEQGAPEQVV